MIMMENTMESSCVPPGFRFHPTDGELVGYYLRKKIASQKIDLDVIRDIDLYRIEPWDLIERCRIGYEEQNEWYFFSHKDKKYPTGTRTNRATMAGFWKATGRDKAVYDHKAKLVGMRKTLVFYKGRAPNGQKTDWIMHEYRLESDENAPPQEEGWVVCRAFKKRTTTQTKTMEPWDSTYFNEEPSGVSSIVDPLDYNTINRQQPSYNSSFLNQTSLMCKQEIEAENLIFAHSNHQFVQLPQLASPSLMLMKRPSNSVSPLSENYNNEEENPQTKRCNTANNKANDNNKVTSDWRALDKFVASQLSQEEQRYEGGIGDEEGDALLMSSFGSTSSSSDHLALLLLQNGNHEEEEEEGNKLNEFLSSDPCDFGICIFDK